MRKGFLLISFCVWAAVLLAQTRIETPLNREWRYCIGDHPGAEEIAYDDTCWETVGLPHSFSIPYFMSKDFYVGYGWYRKVLQLSATELRGRSLFLVFDGVFQEAEVYVNGRIAGKHQGGYTAFCVDITPFVMADSNVVAVRVNNLWRATVAPRGGEHVFSGGIYRGVRLVSTSNVAHVRWQGISITTPALEKNKGRASTVEVKVDVENHSAKRLHVKTDIIDADGKIVDHGGKVIRRPHLWSPETPYLYKAYVRVYDGCQLLDEETVPFGFRWFRWSKSEGFFLNGKHLFFHGANVHQDQAGWGDAVTEEAARRDVRMIKEAGFTMIRGSHYPHSQAFVDECDRQGILFWSEAPFWGTAGTKTDGSWTASAYPVNAADTAAFERNALQQLEEMILQHRNHPSVFVWSMCNEPFFTAEGTMPGVKQLLHRMVERAHQLDPTRPAAIGGAQRPLGKDRIDNIGDVAGYNGDGARLPDFQQPDVASVVSEYGSTTADRPGKYFPGWGDLGRDEGWKGRTWRGGQAIWCGFDHGSIFGEQMGKMGIVDYFRLPKRLWYWYRHFYRGIEPPPERIEGIPAAVVLTASKTKGIRADGTDDVQLVASIVDDNGHALSNSPDVTLRIVSGPGEFPTGRSITFAKDSDIRIIDGQCAVALRSYYAGQTIVEAACDGLRSDTVTLQFIGAPEYEPGVSPQVSCRPYVRYTRLSRELQTYGLNNPTFASSNANGHSAGLAADGNMQTYWQPSPNDKKPYWILDTERGLLMKELQVAFARPATVCVEVSEDQEHWTKVSDIIMKLQADIVLAKAPRARFVRLTFPSGTAPQLLEVKVKGYVL